MPIRTLRPLFAFAIGAGIVLSACSSSQPSREPAPAVADGRTPKATPAEAVRALLAAEQQGDHDASFHLLSSMALTTHPDAESWGKRRMELPEITAFTVNSTQKDVVVTTVSHDPGLDPFVGLRAAHDTQRWTVTKERGGWLVDAEPQISFDLPSDGTAPVVALQWAKAVQACDQSKATALQVEPDLLGTPAGPLGLCKSTSTLKASKPAPTSPGPGSAELVSQYGDSALSWSRTVEIDGGPTAVSVVLAPIGSNWRVLGLVNS